MSIQLQTIGHFSAETLDFTNEYKTLPARRGFLTRRIKSHTEFVSEIESALAREDSSKGYFRGEKYYPHHLSHYKAELAELIRLRSVVS